jgi:hypothetical protein
MKRKKNDQTVAGFFGLALAIESQLLTEIPIHNAFIIRLNSSLVIESFDQYKIVFLINYLIISFFNYF